MTQELNVLNHKNHTFLIGYRDKKTNKIRKLKCVGDFTLEEIRKATFNQTATKSIVILVPDTMKSEFSPEVA